MSSAEIPVDDLVCSRLVCRSVAAILMVAAFPIARVFADADALVVQALDGQLVTGRISDDLALTEIPSRVFPSQFPSTNAWNNPGFHSLGTAPAGTAVLPENGDLRWDFVPMTIGDTTSNLFFWDGQGETAEDVDFSLPPSSTYSLALFGRNNETAAADGTPLFIPGKTIGLIGSGTGLRLHAHRFFFLDDNDGLAGTLPQEGIYLIAMQLRMEGYATSDPFFLVWGTLGIPQSAIEAAAVPWVTQRLETLATPMGDFDGDGHWDCRDLDELTEAIVSGATDPRFDLDGDGLLTTADVTDSSRGWLAVGGGQTVAVTGGSAFLMGDANLDGTVDVSDFNVWNGNRLNQTSAWCRGDFNIDGSVDVSDFNVWNQNKFSQSSPAQAVPEPAGGWLMVLGVFSSGGLSSARRRRPRP